MHAESIEKGVFMSETEVARTLALVIVGFDVSSIEKFKQQIGAMKIIKEKGFDKERIGSVQAPPGVPPFPVSYKITNNHFLSIQYNMLDKKLIITQNNYRENSYNQDETIIKILEVLLTIAPAASLTGFGINYNTDVVRDDKLCLFNKNIETKLGKNFWDTNIGFRTELAFKNNEYTSVYRIFKDEALSKEKGQRFYSFDVNFDFVLNEDNNAAKIVELFKNNEDYFKVYEENIKHILEL